MKQQFKHVAFRRESLSLIYLCNQIIALYQAQGYRLTLRQLYYQLVTRNAIPNQEKSYKHVGSLVSDGRLAGMIDWSAIEDRIRLPRQQNEFKDLAELVNVALSSYRLPRWANQKHYVELWVEKDALAGVLQPLASEYHITMMVNRGYSSQSAMYDAFLRFSLHGDQRGKRGILLYLGDMDPSGEDMVRDIQDRLTMFGADVDVKKIALTMDQVSTYNPPPNPAKISDSRFERYAAKHGNSSWEVDALPPDVLSSVIRNEVETICDMALIDTVKEQEEADKEDLRIAAKGILNSRRTQL